MKYTRLWVKRDKRRYWKWRTEQKHELAWGFRVRYADGTPFPVEWIADHYTHRCHRSRSGPRR